MIFRKSSASIESNSRHERPSTSHYFTTASLVVPLSTLGAATAVVLLKAQIGRAMRRLINAVDPIQPNEDEVINVINGSDISGSNTSDNIDSPLNHQIFPSLMPSQVENYIKESEDKPVVLGAERCVYWAKGFTNKKTKYAVVFLHGWGACRQECRPVPERIAEAIGANLYCGRLPGHGRRHRRGRLGGGGPDGETLVEEATPSALMDSAVEAMKMGLALGDKVILLGMSTGGVLATWLASLPSLQESIAGVVLISPAYALGHPLYPVLKHSFATLRLFPGSFGNRIRRWLIGAIIGHTKASPALSDEHQRFNSLVYPSAALLNLLDVLWTLETTKYSNIAAPSIIFGNPNDHITNFRVKAINAFLRFGEAPKAIHCVTGSEHPHVIASEILSPSSVDEIAETAILFLKCHVVCADADTSAGDRISSLSSQSDRSVAKTGRIHSMPTGMGSFASYSSLKDLRRPFEV